MNQPENKCVPNYNFVWISFDSMINHNYIQKVRLLSIFIVELCI